MAWALVGTIGTVATAAGGTAVTPSFGTGESRTAGNTLICWVGGRASATLPATPSGWTLLFDGTSAAGTGATATIFGKIAAGSDTAPTIAAATGVTWYAQLAEYSGGPATLQSDQTGSANGTVSTLVATSAAADVAATDLVLTASIITHSPAAAATISNAFNNGTDVTTSNSTVSAVGNYAFSYCVAPTSNAAADKNTFTFTTTPVAGVTVIGSLKLIGVAGPLLRTLPAPRNKTFFVVRGHRALPVPPQEMPVVQRQPRMMLRQPFRQPRGRQISPVPPQRNPVSVPGNRWSSSRSKFTMLRRGRIVTPVPPQIPVPPMIPGNRWSTARSRFTMLVRGHRPSPVPTPAIVAPPSYVPPKLGVAKRFFSLTRSKRTSVPPASDTPLRRTRAPSRLAAPPRRRGREVPVQITPAFQARRPSPRIVGPVRARRRLWCPDAQPFPLVRRAYKPRIIYTPRRRGSTPITVSGGHTYTDTPTGTLIFTGSDTDVYTPPYYKRWQGGAIIFPA